MRKLYLLTSIAMGVLLLFATMAWAQEATIFDSAERIVIRAYLEGPNPTDGLYAACLQVRNSDGTFLPTPDYNASQIVVTHLSDQTQLPIETTSPCVGAYRIHPFNLTSPDIGVSQDDVTGTIYVFCIDETWHAMKFVVQNLALTGACGASGGGTFTSIPTTNLCSIGQESTVTGTGPWNWTCTVNGQTPTNCSANIQTWKITPSAGSGGSISPSTQQTVNSGSTTSFTVTPNSGNTATVGGTCGGSPTTGATPFTYTTNAITSDCTVSATFALTPVNGVCGPSNNGTFSTLSSTSSGLCQPGFSVINFLGSGPWTWNCQGLNGGDNSPQCSANKSSGTVDLDFTRYYGMIYGITSSGCATNGGTCSVSLSIVNNGNGPAGNFNVKLWISGSAVVDANAHLIGTWNVPGLAAGQTLAGTISGTFSNLPVHVSYYMIIKIDADNQVAESNETNNILSTYGNVVLR